MIVGLLLLDQNDCYVRENGRLPKRPSFDKNLLLGICQNQQPLVSDNTKKDLPESMLNALDMTNFLGASNKDLALSPDKIDESAHLLIITRGSEEGTGKKFRFDKFKRLVKMYDLEIWVRDYDKIKG